MIPLAYDIDVKLSVVFYANLNIPKLEKEIPN
jgi:hypothetical protein